jgi:two-component system, cell cycle sensor histidine kinase and response regulator CckA
MIWASMMWLQVVIRGNGRRLTGVPALLILLAIPTLIAVLAIRFIIVRRQARAARAGQAQAQAELAALVAAMTDTVVVIDRDGTFRRVVETGAHEKYGATTDLTGKNIADIVPPEAAEIVRATTVQVIATGKTIVTEITVPIEGSPTPFLATASPFDDRSALWVSRDISAQKQAQAELAASETRYRLLFEQNPCAMWVYEVDSLRIVQANDAAVEQYGYTRDEFMRMTLRDLRAPEEAERLESMLRETQFELPYTHLARHRKKDGTPIDVEVRGQPLPIDNRRTRIVVVTDVTERTRLEARLRQSQKLEAVGALAGGVAHDFNNVLTVVGTYGRLLSSALPKDSELSSLVDEILMAADRATALTGQLLSFSRGRVVQPRLLDLRHLLHEVRPMLARLIGEDIELVVHSDDAALMLIGDPTELTQVLLNLVVNARDAMPTGGLLTIEAGRANLTEEYSVLYPGTAPGRHVVLSVSDTGIGMSAATQSRIFEPFFTTKPEGKGTGLGLSTVFGIVKQSGGSIWVYSEPERGTMFKVYFPEAMDDIAPKTPTPAAVPIVPERRSSPPSEHAGVLVVEDDPIVRRVAVRVLERAGHAVYAVADGEEALDLMTRYHVDVVVTDTVMPNMGGRELASRLAHEYPDVAVVLTSGYTADTLQRQGPMPDAVTFVEKPYTPESLERAVHDALNALAR